MESSTQFQVCSSNSPTKTRTEDSFIISENNDNKNDNDDYNGNNGIIVEIETEDVQMIEDSPQSPSPAPEEPRTPPRQRRPSQSSTSSSSPSKLSPTKRLLFKDDNNYCNSHNFQQGSPRKFPRHGHEDLEETERGLGIDRLNDPEWDEERRHYQKIVATFRRYSEYATNKLKSNYNYLKTLPKHHRRLLDDYKLHLQDLKRCIDENQNLCILMILEECHLFENQHEIYPKTTRRRPPEPTAYDYEKIQAVFKQIARDWSTDGERERELCYKPLIDEVETLYKDTKDENGYSDIRILVPGAGLGRLAHELVCRGYVVEGNEFSLFMIFASNFLLNKCSNPSAFKCYPWIHQTTNVLSRADQLRPLQFPDVNPSVLPPDSKFSMTAGDFLEVYATPKNTSSWDCLVTCFFIDCANNIVAYMERIYKCLKEGGYWINIGPLLYHYADLSDEKSIEPPFDILRDIIIKLGFSIEKEQTNMPTLYADNSKSMLSYTYNSVFLVCRKPFQEKKIVEDFINNDTCKIKEES